MNEQKAVIWKWATGLLVLCNIALLATIWLKPGMQPGGPREAPRDFVIRNLKFSDQQVAGYDALIRLHRRAIDSLREEATQCRQQLFGKLKTEHTATLNPDSMALAVGNIQSGIELVTFRHFEQVKALCTEDQKKVFDQIIGEVIKKMNGNGRHHGPPPPGRHEGPDGDGPPQEDGPPPPRDR